MPITSLTWKPAISNIVQFFVGFDKRPMNRMIPFLLSLMKKMNGWSATNGGGGGGGTPGIQHIAIIMAKKRNINSGQFSGNKERNSIL